MESMIGEAKMIIEKGNLEKNKIIVLAGDWPKGIIGPSASQIADKYHRPVIVFSTKGGEYTGSARSVKKVNIFELISKSARYLIKFGGHKGAAGLSVMPEKYEQFVQEIIRDAEKDISDDDLISTYNIDMEVDFNKLTFDLVEKISMLEPFGMGNPKPVFLSKGVVINEPKVVGKNKNHLSMTLEHSNQKIKSIYFSHPLKTDEIRHNTKADILYNVSIDYWNNNRYLNINIQDMDLYGQE